MYTRPGKLRHFVDEPDDTVGIPGSDNQIFIIRIRAVHREIQGAVPVWRGEIEHLNTGRKAFLKALTEIIPFIRPVLEEMGIETSDQVVGNLNWLAHLKTFLSGKSRMQNSKSRTRKSNNSNK
jgi:hypothetical protein